jgi:hypothetical protein
MAKNYTKRLAKDRIICRNYWYDGDDSSFKSKKRIDLAYMYDLYKEFLCQCMVAKTVNLVSQAI